MSILYECDRCGMVCRDVDGWGSFDIVRHQVKEDIRREYLLCKYCTTEVITVISSTKRRDVEVNK